MSITGRLPLDEWKRKMLAKLTPEEYLDDDLVETIKEDARDDPLVDKPGKGSPYLTKPQIKYLKDLTSERNLNTHWYSGYKSLDDLFNRMGLNQYEKAVTQGELYFIGKDDPKNMIEDTRDKTVLAERELAVERGNLYKLNPRGGKKRKSIKSKKHRRHRKRNKSRKY
jgi:hypothetical protein